MINFSASDLQGYADQIAVAGKEIDPDSHTTADVAKSLILSDNGQVTVWLWVTVTWADAVSEAFSTWGRISDLGLVVSSDPLGDPDGLEGF